MVMLIGFYVSWFVVSLYGIVYFTVFCIVYVVLFFFLVLWFVVMIYVIGFVIFYEGALAHFNIKNLGGKISTSS